ncbi:response regulator [Glycomyces sp. YM15]|uniref:response regulator n=1 Tax=Glycomyces sp. YM15 TaxID=2800446 RepID=UPI0019668929|nr:response regulator [Glycomyces sp. YM15]
MSEAIWIELIKIIPTFVWLGLGLGALFVAKRLLAQQAHRMTRVESPFVSVDFAQDAIEQAFNRGPETPAAETEGAAPVSGPPLPAEGADEAQWRRQVPVEPGGWATPAPGGSAEPGVWNGSRPDDSDATHMLRPRRPADDSDEDELDLESLLDEIAAVDGANDGEGVQTAPAAREPRPAETPPNGGPVYPAIPAQQGLPARYPPPAAPPGGTTAYRPPSYFAATADPQRGLRAATRLAGAADLLQGGAILWVDDHPHWNEPLIRLFRTAGMRVDPVGTTEEALRYLDRDDYDLVITDLRRERDPGDQVAGMALLDRMVARGFPTPAIVFSDNPQVRTMSHPRAAATTNSPEELVNHVVDLVAHRRNAMNQPQRSNRGGLFFGNG